MKLFQAATIMFILAFAPSFALAGGALIGGNTVAYPEYPTKRMVKDLNESFQACLVNTYPMAQTQEDGEVLIVMCAAEVFKNEGWDLSETILVIAQAFVDQSEYATLARKSGLYEMLSHPIEVIFNRPGARERLLRSGDISQNLYSKVRVTHGQK
jgi:hypothetical protein